VDSDFSVFAASLGKHHVDDAHHDICESEYKKLFSVFLIIHFITFAFLVPKGAA
jgi:hypothetical protein